MSERSQRLWRAYRRVAPLVYFPVLVGWALVRDASHALDAHAYWMSGHTADLYAIGTPGQPDAYLYSPAFAQVLSPLSSQSWPVFASAWAIVLGLALYAVAREWSPLLLLLVGYEIYDGNINLLLACVLAFGLRRPSLWAFALLTKPTIGICLLWFVLRREWGKLAEALLATALIAAVSALLAPALWGQWIALLLRNQSAPGWLVPLPLVIRLAIAVVLVVAAAIWRRPIVLPVAAVLASPVVWQGSLTILVACLRLRSRVEPRPAPVAQSTATPVPADV